ncbi:MAG: murein hydrolase activator EnvC family protein [Actinomycetota bacterium]
MRFAAPTRAARIAIAGVLVTLSLMPALAGRASGQESLSEYENQMQQLQADLDASSERVEQLRAEEFRLRARISDVGKKRDALNEENYQLTKDVVARAQELYMSGGAGAVEALLAAEDFGEFADRAEMLSRVAEEESGVFVALERNNSELEQLEKQLEVDSKALASTLDELEDEKTELQNKLASVTDEYKDLKAQIERERAAEAAAAAAAAQPTSSGGAVPTVSVPTTSTNGKTCPVAGPVSFIDSWGYPRSGGRSHEGVDMMADYGTPVVAITAGTITYSGYGGSAGNWQILSGSDGNAYWYMHNQQNIVNGGSVSAGQQIATVGDTGNATGMPHLHFEYHPGGGGAVNPYPLVASLC